MDNALLKDTIIDQDAPLPSFDPALGTRNACLVGLALSWAVGLGSLITGSVLLFGAKSSASDPKVDLGELLRTFIPLLFNVLVTGCVECLGYIHTISLRWALWREGRLEFSSNLRLFTSSRECPPNRWYTNALSAVCITVCYSGSAQLLLADIYNPDFVTHYFLNRLAVFIIGLGLLGLSGISTWCLLVTLRSIPTWSSNPLTIALACRSLGLPHHPGRCLVSVWDDTSTRPVAQYPREVQKPSRRGRPAVRHLTRLQWALFLLTVIWGSIMLYITRRIDHPPDTGFLPVHTGGSGLSPPRVPYDSNPALSNFFVFLVITTLQIFLTLALHSAELLVNLSRDEKTWRCSTSIKGAPLHFSSIIAAATSWQTVLLFALKPVSHWLFGLSAVGMTGAVVSFRCTPIFCLAGASLLLAVFCSVLTILQPRGPQPVAWGHIRTLADLVDDWRVGKEGRLWWGDKGEGIGTVRLAGTSGNKMSIGAIRMDCLYGG
jgi:hypothetical protein